MNILHKRAGDVCLHVKQARVIVETQNIPTTLQAFSRQKDINDQPLIYVDGRGSLNKYDKYPEYSHSQPKPTTSDMDNSETKIVEFAAHIIEAIYHNEAPTGSWVRDAKWPEKIH